MVHFYSLVLALSFFALVQTFDFKKFINNNDPDSNEFATLVDKFKLKMKDGSEVAKRLSNFRKAKTEIAELKMKYKNAHFAPNKFALMTDEERKRVSLSCFWT